MDRVEISATFVTPCFLGGANNTETAEWRAASIRGQLRWWFRAVAGSSVDHDTTRLRELEESTWGSTRITSRLRVRVESLPKGSIEHNHVSFEMEKTGTGKSTIAGLSYLGFGPVGRMKTGETYLDKNGKQKQKMEFRNIRPFIKPGSTGKLTIESRRGPLTPCDRLVVAAWACLGGLGSRCRRGYGSLLLTSNRWTFDRKAVFEELCAAAKIDPGSLANSRFTSFPPYSALSSATRLLTWKEPYTTWQAAMQAAGASLITFRRRYNSSAPTPSRDYAWAYDPHNEAQVPDRVGFGLPLQFGVKGDPTGKVLLNGETHERRASPLLFHIAREGSGYRIVILYMPARFLPASEFVIYGGNSGKGGKGHIEARHFQIIEDYLGSLISSGKAEEVAWGTP